MSAVVDRLTDHGWKADESGTDTGKWKAQCPVHGNPGSDLNLHLAYGTDNPDALVLHCKVCGMGAAEYAAAFVQALDLASADLFNRDGQEVPEEPPAPPYEEPKDKREKPTAVGKPKVVATHPYKDISGQLLYERRRFEPGFDGERKSVTTRRPDGRGGWITTDVFKGPGAPAHIPYNAQELHLAAIHGDPVVITEGEQAADRLMSMDILATTLDGGAGATWTPQIVAYFLGVSAVRLFMDDDDHGRDWARNAIAALAPVVPEITVHKSITGMCGDDVVDHLDAGHGLDDLESVPLAAFRTAEEEWPDPPMPLDSPKLPAFPTHLLGALAPMVRAVSTTFQCPEEYAALCGLGAIDTVIGGQVQVKLKANWLEKHTGKFLMGFGDPSDGKSLAMDEMFAPVTSSVAQYAATVRSFLNDEQLQEKLGFAPAVPRAIVEDTTFESLIAQLGKHRGRMELVSDEGGIFKMLGGLYAGSGKASNDAIMHKGYSGSSYTYDRVGTNRKGESVLIPLVKLGMCVLAQPGILRGMEAANPNFKASGFLARILYAIPAPLPDYVLDVPDIPESVSAQYARKIRMLFDRFWVASLPYEFKGTSTNASASGWEAVEGRGSITDHEPAELRVLTPPESVRLDFLTFNVDIRQRSKHGGDLYDVAYWAGKLPGMTARVAAALTLFENPDAQELSEKAARDAMAMAPYWIAHARAAFRLMSRTGTANEPAMRVREWARTHTKQGQPFSVSDVHQAMRFQFSWYENKADSEAALAVLEAYGWARSLNNANTDKKPGRPPSPKFLMHPLTYGNYDADDAADGVFSVSSGTWSDAPYEDSPEKDVSSVSRGIQYQESEPAQSGPFVMAAVSEDPLETLETPAGREVPAHAALPAPRNVRTPEQEAEARAARAAAKAAEREEEHRARLGRIATDALTEAATGNMIPAPCGCGVSPRHVDISLCVTCIRAELTVRGESVEPVAEFFEPVPAAPSRKKGGRPPKFTDQQAAGLLARVKDGEKQSDLCRETGVGASTMSTVLKRAREAAKTKAAT